MDGVRQIERVRMLSVERVRKSSIEMRSATRRTPPPPARGRYTPGANHTQETLECSHRIGEVRDIDYGSMSTAAEH